MDSRLRKILTSGLLCLASFLAVDRAQAQIILWGGESGNYFRPGTYVPYEGQLYQQRYAYSTEQPYFLYNRSMTGSQLQYLSYLDKVDRALKFGYPLPPPPPGVTPVVTTQPPEVYQPRPRIGLGLGIFRRY